jgi:hypothetical protein
MKSEEDVHPLILSDLPHVCPKLTQTAGQYIADAAIFCFHHRGHAQGTMLEVDGHLNRRFVLSAINMTEQIRNTYDMDEAIELGACAVAILVIRNMTGLTVIRARKGVGIDYWLGEDQGDLPFQNTARLEVSGILLGDHGRVTARVKEKLEQVRASEGLLPAYICVVEFGRPMMRVELR